MALTKKKSEEILERVRADVDEAEQNVNLRSDRWLERMAFYRGMHYSIYDGHFQLEVDDPTGEVSETHNFIPAFVKAAVATRLKQAPNPRVPAADGNHRSQAKARATERLLRSFVDDDILTGEEFIRALHSAAILGGAWLKPYWDPFAGKPLAMDDPTEPDEDRATDVFGAEVPFQAFEGQIKLGFVDLFDGWADPSASKPDEMRYWVHRKVRPVEELERKFPVDIWGKEADWRGTKLDAIWAQKQSVTSSDAQSVLGSGSGSRSEDNDLAVVFEYWRAPDEDYPNGMLVVYSEHRVLYMGPCPYVPARIPALFLPGDNIVPGGFFPEGVVEPLIQPQRTLNRAESKIRETMDKMLNPHILVPHAADVEEDLFGEIAGQVIKYNAGYPPHILHAPEVPTSMFNISASMVGRMKEISTYTDISRGDVPGRVESGTALAFLQETENAIRSADLKLYRQTMLACMKQCLWLAKQHYQDGRMIRTLGEDSWTLLEFQANDYDWDVDLAPEPFSSEQDSGAARWAKTMEAFNVGLYDDDRPGAREVRRLLQLNHASGASDLLDRTSRHRSIARAELNQVVQMSLGRYAGPLNPVREFHDHEVHLDEHNDFRNSQEYLDLTAEARRALDDHCEEHNRQLELQMQEYAVSQGMLGGAQQGIPGAAPKELQAGKPLAAEEPTAPGIGDTEPDPNQG